MERSTTWKSPPLDPNAAHQVKIQAVNSLGEVGPFSPIATITTASPAPPAAPTAMVLTPLVSAIQIDWTESATTDGVRGTQILYSELSGLDADLHLIDEVPRGTSTYIKGFSGTGGHWSNQFFALRAVLSVMSVTGDDIFGAHCPPFSTIPLTDTPVARVSTPLIGQGVTGTLSLGTANFRVLIVDTQGGMGPASLFFSINDGPFVAYSATGNYKSSTSGAVLPTNNNGEISVGVGDKVLAYGTQVGFLQSAFSVPFFNNGTNAPNRGGTGTGVTIVRLP